jgi:hypothetical protein
LPPFSRGGMVRRPSRGNAVSGVGIRIGCPSSRSTVSRASAASNSSGDGATPMTPAWVEAATAMPGSSPDRATPSRSSHRTSSGASARSPTIPSPGSTAVQPNASVS